MAATPEEIAALKAQREALKKAMRSGARDVQHGDKRVQYRSIAEMKAVLDDIEDEIGNAEGNRRGNVFYVGGGRGYE